MKNGYIYDHLTKEFLGGYAAQESPLEPGEFIIPECFTEMPPPALSENEATVWAGDAWEIAPDFRGCLIYDQATGEAVEVTSLGPLPSGFALTPPPTCLAAKVRAERAAKLSATNWLVERHREEQETGTTTLTAQQYAELLAYRQALRDVPAQAGFPEDIEWPLEP